MALTFDSIPEAIEETLQRLETIEKLLVEKSRPKTKLEQDYITRKDASRLLHISLPTLHNWIKQGKIQAYHIGGRTLFKKKEVLEAVKPLDYNLERKGGNKLW